MVPALVVQVLECGPREIWSATIFISEPEKTYSGLSGSARGVSTIMFSRKPKSCVVGAFAALAALALSVSCTGFFVNPTVTSLAIGPANLSLAPDASFQMVASATYSDGSTKDATGQSVWISSSPNIANFSSPGKITATGLANLTTLPGTTTVSASLGTVTSSTQTVNVCPVVQTLKLTVNNGGTSATVPGSAQVTFVLDATFNGVTGTTDVTSYATWNISNTSVLATITGGTGTTNSGSPGTASVSATICGATSNSVTVTTTS